MLGADASRVEVFADLGVRVIQLTYNPANTLGDGSMAPQNRGLTRFGREVVERLNAARLMVDLSHSGERTCLEAARASRAPISINHTGCRALVDLPRNKTDEELRLVASRGGFVGIYFMPFVDARSVCTAADVVAHLDHAVNVCGEDHVGIGTDGGTTGVDDMAAYRAAMRAEVAGRRAAGIGARGENPDTLPFCEELSGPGPVSPPDRPARGAPLAGATDREGHGPQFHRLRARGLGVVSQAWIQLVNTAVVPVGLMLVMFSLGLTLALQRFRFGRAQPDAGRRRLRDPFVRPAPARPRASASCSGLPPEMALGLFIVSLCPAGTTSNAMTFVGRGNVALAVVLTALTQPRHRLHHPDRARAGRCPGFLGGGARRCDRCRSPALILPARRITLLPIAVGMLVRHFAPDLAARMARWLRPTALRHRRHRHRLLGGGQLPDGARQSRPRHPRHLRPQPRRDGLRPAARPAARRQRRAMR